MNYTGGGASENSSLKGCYAREYYTGNCKTAFTLAEVLITLGIIGVVAAMTLPALINKTNKYILKQQFKKAYNTLLNANQRVFAEKDFYLECYYDVNGAWKVRDCSEYLAAMKKVMDPVSVCTDNAYEKGCIPKYKGVDTIVYDKYEGADDQEEHVESIKRNCNGFSQENILKNREAWVLKDGTIIGFPYDMIFYVDINGNKSPNKWGHDVFVFKLKTYDKPIPQIDINSTGCAGTMVEDGGVYAREMLLSSYKK